MSRESNKRYIHSTDAQNSYLLYTNATLTRSYEESNIVHCVAAAIALTALKDFDVKANNGIVIVAEEIPGEP